MPRPERETSDAGRATTASKPAATSARASQAVLLAIVPLVAALLIRLLGATLRYETIVEPGGFAQKKDSPPGVYAFWHRCLLPAAHAFRNWKIAILISRSKDGELIARTVERLGFLPVRGSSSRAGASGLAAARTAFEAGYNAAFTADGPRGPLYVAKPGAVQLAALVGERYIGAFYLHPQRAWQLNSWDRFLVPKPFSRVVVSFARVVELPGGELSRDGAESKREELQAAMERARAAAERGHW